MVTSVVGFIFGGYTQTTRYNGIKFTDSPQGWKANINDHLFYFTFLPSDLNFIEFPESLDLTNIKQIDITSDANSTSKEEIASAVFELSSILSKAGIFVRQGFIANNTFNRQILTCEDSTQFVPVIFFDTGNDTIKHEGNCIIVESETSFVALADGLAYKMLGII